MSLALIAGTGLIGRGWAVAFARAGWHVHLWDHDPDAAHLALDTIAEALADLEAAGLFAGAAEAVERVVVRQTIDAATAGADYIQESVPEDVATKNAVIKQLDTAADSQALIGSSTSTFPGERFLADVPGRERCMVAHPANPPHLMPAVELVPSKWHSDAVLERFRSILASIGQVPVVVKREIGGFVMNRLQTAVVNEAVALVAADVIDPADLDAVMKHSLGLRWALMGPFETMDLNAPSGFLDYANRYGKYYQSMGRQLSVAEDWPDAALQKIEQSQRDKRPKQDISARMRARDQALMGLLSLKSTLEAKE